MSYLDKIAIECITKILGDNDDRTLNSKNFSHIIEISRLSIDWYYSQHHTLLPRHFFLVFAVILLSYSTNNKY